MPARSGRSTVIEEEAQCGHGAVHRRRVHAALGLLDLIAADVLSRGGAGRAAEEGGKASDGAEVIVLRLGGEPAHGHVGGEALAKGADRVNRRENGHGELLGLKEHSSLEPDVTHSISIHERHETPTIISCNKTNSRASGFVLRRKPDIFRHFWPNLTHKKSDVGASGCVGIHQAAKSRCSPNDVMSIVLCPAVTSSATASPIAAECLKPCPEQGETARIRSLSG